ncbi:hypothetical protein BGZ61DRAFT_460292 [Ilyonectria robusta]|uniref:uncharacterized protein n=1 Tax=Ilyonectria robusta TaxID=1079257 RepID=UPI001E8CEDA5|nr:uncharacterized protein BGZ61DRAFT_460292 [Ilyonectria robusta]KAH8669963.1 hypothetical protein BGZ61DRAFT_460292 [Ilyonectria robusta]
MASSTASKDEAMFQVATYARRETIRDVFRFDSHEHDLVRDSLRDPFPAAPGSGMGTLNTLPRELRLNIFQLLDIRSHLRVRQVSRGMRQAASSTKGYREVAEHGLEVVRTTLLEKTKFEPTILDVYQLLITPECSMCPQFGDYLSKLTFKRCCHACATGENTTSLRNVFTSLIPGGKKIEEQFRRRFVPRSLIWSSEDLPDEPAGGFVQGMTFIAKSYDTSAPTTRPRDFRNYRRPDTLYFMGIANAVLFPYYDPDSAGIHHGFSCKGCHAGGQLAATTKAYTKEQMLAHIKKCRHARTLFAKSQKKKTVGSLAAPGSTSGTAE